MTASAVKAGVEEGAGEAGCPGDTRWTAGGLIGSGVVARQQVAVSYMPIADRRWP
jgi:hypothetical protein